MKKTTKQCNEKSCMQSFPQLYKLKTHISTLGIQNPPKQKMKSAMVPLAVVLFLSVSFFPNAILSEPVYDIEGDKVMAGAEYYMVSTIWGAGGGGVDLFPGRNGICPLDVGQHGSDLERGTPVMFLPVHYDSTSKTPREVEASVDLNIVFNTERRLCNSIMPVWRVDDYDDDHKARFITSTGFVGHPGANSLRNWFKLEKISPGSDLNSYKIVHCPSVCDECIKLCGDVGLNLNGGFRRLALAETAKAFSLVKAGDVDKYMGKINAII